VDQPVGRRLLRGEPELAPEIPEPVEAIILRAMAKNPDDRYQDMADLDAALAPYDTGGAKAGGPRARTTSVVVAALCVFVIAAIVALLAR
jgi:serine/threonine-protein kinase